MGSMLVDKIEHPTERHPSVKIPMEPVSEGNTIAAPKRT
jgi:hypothetical protein